MVFFIIGIGYLLFAAAGWSVMQLLADPRLIPMVILYILSGALFLAAVIDAVVKVVGLVKSGESALQLAPYRRPLILLLLAFLILVAATAIVLMMISETTLFDYLMMPFNRS